MKDSFITRGFHIDLRVQAMPMPALRQFVSELADFGLNTLLVEWEATYPYEKHAIISNEYAYTREEVESFISYCADIGIQVIPLQQCFGHIEYILRHDRYAHLRESRTDICQLCPQGGEAVFEVVRELLSEMASLHPSKYIHIGGDETYLLGHCERCRTKAQRDGLSKLYVDYFKEVAQWVVKLGRRPVLWADMLLKYPEAVGEMPEECVFVDWNYGRPPGRFSERALIQCDGFELWGAAALRSHPDNHSLVSWEKHFCNIRDFIPFARTHGYSGMIMTSWSTSGVYGFEWDQLGELTEMHPIRRVYPLSGFRILVAAYARSLKQQEPVMPEEFVRRYAVERFGLSLGEGTKLWQSFAMDATVIQPDVDPNPILVTARKARQILMQLKPQCHEGEFEHFRLMADLREFEARFKVLESEIQSASLTAARLRLKVRALARLIKESEALDRRFMKCNRGFLYESGLAEEVQARSKKLRKLYDRLARSGRKSAKTPTGLVRLKQGWTRPNVAKTQPVHLDAAPVKLLASP